MDRLEEFRRLNFEDCEVDLVSFLGDAVRINVVNPNRNVTTLVTFENVSFFIAETEHIQNVITSITVFDSKDDAIAQLDCRDFLARKGIDVKRGNGKFAYFRPNTGFECFIEFKELSWTG